MEFETYTDRAKGCRQSAQTMALRRGHQRLTPGYPSIVKYLGKSNLVF